ncbi:DUF2062 domain-containing protein [Marivita hallyeonensis]|uniref:DUF2062 domain-containing protein n=1 Tax=Marivita hallyeonensis TaxID=996342 RepID=A0A1M5XBX3_9RHOB|nr:DUF2062 domain-containing protein [Marivita hallyeonensis]SHH97068.1 hypothetical protein SAMN05443551_3821 [Marivita hallyeonensis]
MVFKRRDRRSILTTLREALWPRGGWARAARYVQHRLNRLPDPPERIARGIFAGVLTTFTPFYGMHFVTAAIIAWVMRGNILAALLSTFFGNPLTYVPISVASLQTGYWLLGLGEVAHEHGSIGYKFAKAGEDLWQNFIAIFTDATADWSALRIFYDEVFFPWLVGGILPGILTGLVCYYLSVPIIRAYQNRRKGVLKAKLASLKKKKKQTDESQAAD